VQLSAFSVVDDEPAQRQSRGGDRYEELIALAREADRAGLDTFWVAEHHFHSGGVLPSPPVLLAAIARETKRIRLGVMVTVLPLHNPREIAEQYALVDRISGGRLEIGVGSGYIPTELQGFGVLPSERRARFDHDFPEFVSALSGEALPVAGDPTFKVQLNVAPIQRPHPPLWMAVQSREALPFVARRGLSVGLIPYASVNSIPELARNIQEYRGALPPEAQSAKVAAAMHVFVGPRVNSGREALQRYLDTRLITQSVNFQARVAANASVATVDGLLAQELVVLGDAEQFRARARQLEGAGVTDLLGIFDFGGLEPGQARRSVRRCAEALGLKRGSRASVPSN
jgi:alkanesulfonate monooxygenase SsuD/methylene tetrahydromethanopterin reductase-like flavin-dependent oxidoreductase (luciferase family)